MMEKALKIAKNVLDGPGTKDEKFSVASVMLLAGAAVATKIISEKQFPPMRGADLLFDLKRLVHELEVELGRSH